MKGNGKKMKEKMLLIQNNIGTMQINLAKMNFEKKKKNPKNENISQTICFYSSIQQTLYFFVICLR